MSNLKLVLAFIFSHKLKYLVAFISALIFLCLLFPFRDVGDLVSAQVAKQTGNQVFLQMDRLNVGVFPGPSVGADNLSIETPMIPAISMNEITVTPSFGSLITQQPAGSVIAKGLFRGDVEINVKPGKKTEAGAPTQVVSLKAQSLSLAEINKIAELPVMLKGKLNLATSGTADLTFGDQPDFDLEVHVDQLELPPSTVNTLMGPLNLPDLKLSTVELKGRLSAGRFNIEKGQIGREGDELFGSIKGGVSVVIQNQGGQIRPILGAYDLTLDLSVKKSFQDKAALFLSFLDAFKTPLPDGARYQFRVNATSPQMPPVLGAAVR